MASRTREIAAGAGVAEGTIYLYFDGKDDLLLSAFREKVNEFCTVAGELVESPLPFPRRLERFVALQFEGIEAEPALAAVLLLESRQTSRFYGEAVREVLRSYARAVDDLLESGVAEGEVRKDINIPVARRMLIGALEEIELDWLLGDQAKPFSDVAPQVAAYFHAGISP